ncbi:MAG: septal ring lytic transglycosylase RlpA family protein [Spirulinaceae cyanobacterium]
MNIKTWTSFSAVLLTTVSGAAVPVLAETVQETTRAVNPEVLAPAEADELVLAEIVEETAKGVNSEAVASAELPPTETDELLEIALEVAPEAVLPPLPSEMPEIPEVDVEKVISRATGMASWYGPGFHGRRTANGERFNQNAMTAAHRSLPFNTRVRVTNKNNGRSLVLRINDRGPFIRGRIIDVSVGAAKQLGMYSSGVAPVKVEVLDD